MQEKSYEFFLKFGEEQFMRDLWEEGVVYCNTLDFFRKCDKSQLRGDSSEGSIYNIGGVLRSITFGGVKVDTNIEAHLNIFDKNYQGNIYSLFGVEENIEDENSEIMYLDANIYEVKPSFNSLDFGECCVLITNPKEFINRIRLALDNENIKYEIKSIDYKDYKTYRGKLTPFNKSSIFSDQKEVRIWIPNNNCKEKIINIGSIKDISRLISGDEISSINYILQC